MNKSDLVINISARTGYTGAAVEDIMNAFLDEIVVDLVDGESIKIFPLGILKPVKRASRLGRNPRTGEKVQIPERMTVVLKPSTTLIEMMKGGDNDTGLR